MTRRKLPGNQPRKPLGPARCKACTNLIVATPLKLAPIDKNAQKRGYCNATCEDADT